MLVSGDNGRAGYDEPGAMRTYPVAHGVPDRRIVSDFAGFDTWDSCVRAHRIFGVDDAILISHDFHVRRAVALCRAVGVAGYGIGVAEPRDAVWFYWSPARSSPPARRGWTSSSGPDAHFLGPPEPGVARALATPR